MLLYMITVVKHDQGVRVKLVIISFCHSALFLHRHFPECPEVTLLFSCFNVCFNKSVVAQASIKNTEGLQLQLCVWFLEYKSRLH